MNTNLQLKCKWCNKVAKEVRRSELRNKTIITLACHHTVIRDKVHVESYDEMVSKDGRTPFPFQVETANWMERAGLTGIIGHEQGLGKTVIANLLLKRYHERLTPNLIVVKSGLRMQWWYENVRWTGHVAQIIENSNQVPEFSICDIFIISYDTLRIVRPVEFENEYEETMAILKGKAPKRKPMRWTDEICRQFKGIIIDEAQYIKNPGAGRTKSVKDFVKQMMIGAQERGKDATEISIIPMTGTMIENRPSEAFTALHLVRPMMFPSETQFKANHIRYDQKGKEAGLRDPEGFHEKIKPFYIRFKREDVLPDLPKVFRNFRLVEMDEDFIQTYVDTVKEFQAFMDIQVKMPNPNTLLGWFSRMRNITGVAKVKAAVEWTEEFLLSNNRKLVIFYHHKECGKALNEMLSQICRDAGYELPLTLTADLDMRARHEVVETFKLPGFRILLASILVAGEGLNMQFCSDCLAMERMWNPSKEEQWEGRFPRPGSVASQINATYLLASGTLDEFLTPLIEKKRAIKSEVLDGEELDWENDDNLWTQLATAIQEKGLKRFKGW